MKHFLHKSISFFFAAILCFGLVPCATFAQPTDQENQAAPHEAFNLEEGTYVEGEVLVLVDGQLPQSNARSTQPETQDLFSFTDTVATTREGDILVGEDIDEAIEESEAAKNAESGSAGISMLSENADSDSANREQQVGSIGSALNDEQQSDSSKSEQQPDQLEQVSDQAHIVQVKDPEKSTAELIDEYAVMPGVLYVQPNFIYELASLKGTYTDPYIDKQWFLEDSKTEDAPAGVGVEYAWNQGNYGGSNYEGPTNSLVSALDLDENSESSEEGQASENSEDDQIFESLEDNQVFENSPENLKNGEVTENSLEHSKDAQVSENSAESSEGTPSLENDSTDASSDAAPNAADEEAVVAVIDTGVKYDHPDLQASMWTDGKRIAEELKWDTNNSGVQYGYDTYALTTGDTAEDVDGYGPMDKEGHGTHVSGIIGAQLNNAEGGSGVAPGVKIMALRAANDSFPISATYAAMSYVKTAKELGVNVVAVNNSWGGYHTDTLYTVVANQLYYDGVVVIKSSGNSAKDHDTTPVDNVLVDNSVVVNAIDSNAQLTSFSDFGATETDVAAPGKNIFSTVMDHDATADLSDSRSVVYENGQPLAGPLEIYDGTRPDHFAFVVFADPDNPTNDLTSDNNYLAWNFTLEPDERSVLYLLGSQPIDQEAVDKMTGLAFSCCVDSNMDGGFTLKVYARGKNGETISLGSLGCNQGKPGEFNTAFVQIDEDQKEKIDWDHLTLAMQRTNSSEETWNLSFYFEAAGFISNSIPYAPFDGTSMAGPVVSGVAALIAQDISDKSLTPEQQAAEIRARLIGGAIRDNDSLMGTSQSDGRLDVEKALENPNPVITEVNQSDENPAKATISGFFFDNNPTIEITNANKEEGEVLSLIPEDSSVNSDGSTAYSVTLPEGMEEGSYYIKVTNPDGSDSDGNANWGRMKVSLKGVSSAESGDTPSGDSGEVGKYFETISSLPVELNELSNLPEGKEIEKSGYIALPPFVQAVGSKLYVTTADYCLIDENDRNNLTLLMLVYDTESNTWSVDQNLSEVPYVPLISMAAKDNHLYLVSSDGVRDYDTATGSLTWLIGEEGSEKIETDFGVALGDAESIGYATSSVVGNELWLTNAYVNSTSEDGNIILPSVYAYDLNGSANQIPVAKEEINAPRIGSSLFNVGESMYVTPGGTIDADFAYQVYSAMEKLGEDATEWSNVADVPVPFYGNQQCITASACVDGKIIVSGLRAENATNEGVVPDTFIYDTENDSWSISNWQLSPYKIMYTQGAVASDGYFYVLGLDPQDKGSLFSMKRCKVSDLLNSSTGSEDGDSETTDPGENPGEGSGNKPEEGDGEGQGVGNPDGGSSTSGGLNSSPDGKNALPDTSDELTNYAKGLSALVLLGFVGAIIATRKLRRAGADRSYK